MHLSSGIGTHRWQNLLLQVSFYGDKPWLDQLKMITATPYSSCKFLWTFQLVQGELPTRKRLYHVLRKNTKPEQLIKPTKLSFSIVSVVFHKFLCSIYQNCLNRGTSKLRHSTYLKKSELCYLDTFCWESVSYYTRL